MIKKLCLSLLIFFSSLLFSSAVLFSQNENINSPDVKTLFFTREGVRPAYPVINMSGESLSLHFDLLSDGAEVLYYKIFHCDRRWENSDLFYSDYMEGFEENSFGNYGFSFNTKISYSHYILNLPNEDVSFKISGNYLIKIYRYGEEESPLIERRFMIYENISPMKISFRRPTGKEFTTGQQSEVDVSLNNLGVTDPQRQITLTILQNGRWDMAKEGLNPDFIGSETVEYNTLGSSTLFPGGNEFRYFDIKSIKQRLQNVRAIEYQNGAYHVFLLPSENRGSKQYFSGNDLNGGFMVALDGSDEPDLDADYVYVYFTLPVREEVRGGAVYISGSFNGWQYTPDNKMIYNNDNGCYEGVLLLKQGWYNYEYIVINEGMNRSNGNIFEGNHYETENDYLYLLYYDDPRVRYDRLLNCVIVNTTGISR